MTTIIKTAFKHYRVAPSEWNMFGKGHVDHFIARHGIAVRYLRQKGKRPDWTPNERGGYTTCTLTVTDGIETREIVGIAACSPRDGFCYRDGRELAHFDALRQFYGWKRIRASLVPREKRKRVKLSQGEIEEKRRDAQMRKAEQP